jgi:hypothetical protein
MTRNDLIDSIRKTAAALRTNRLSARAFRQHTGVTMSAIYKLFDSWSEACLAAGVEHGPTHENLVVPPRFSREQCVTEMKRVAVLLGQRQLSTKEFTRHAKFTAKPVIKRFGSWGKALEEAGLGACEKVKLDRPLAVEECVNELKRAARILSTSTLTQSAFDSISTLSSFRIVRACGSWVDALSSAGLRPSPSFKTPIPLEKLAAKFLEVTIELRRIPTLLQLSRRSGYAPDTLSRNRGGYSAFKLAVIEFLLSTNCKFPKDVLGILRNELARLKSETPQDEAKVINGNKHRQGRSLGFRGFAFAPTCEHDVVQLFGAVAKELGFEIIGNRSAFPDCKARRLQKGQRDHFIDCLIEYEFSSLDFRKHRHDPNGCNLIICWEHNRSQCPVEVLELRQAIKNLTGWE